MSIAQYFTSNNIPATHCDLATDAVGDTGYIDRLNPENFGSGFYYGVDPHGREYAAIKVQISEFFTDADPIVDSTVMLVAFQRYTERPDFWVCVEAGINGLRDTVLNAVVEHVLKGKPRQTWSQGGYTYASL